MLKSKARTMITSKSKFLGRVANVFQHDQYRENRNDGCVIVVRASKTLLCISTNKPLSEMPCEIGDFIYVSGRIVFNHKQYGVYITTLDNIVELSIYPKGDK